LRHPLGHPHHHRYPAQVSQGFFGQAARGQTRRYQDGSGHQGYRPNSVSLSARASFSKRMGMPSRTA
jgi:hypothetical protein